MRTSDVNRLRNFRILFCPCHSGEVPFASSNLAGCVQFAVLRAFLRAALCISLCSIYRRYTVTDTSCGAQSRWQSSCAAPDSVTLSSRAPQLDVPASRKNDARSWLDPAHWTVTRRGLAHATLRDVQDDRGWREVESGTCFEALERK